MQKLFKIGIIASLALFTLGVGFVIAAVALGATWAQFTDAMDTGEFSLDYRMNPKSDSQDTNQIYYTDVDSLDIQFGAGALDLVETDDDRILVEFLSDSRFVQTNVDDDTLEISTVSDVTKRKKISLRIHIPKDKHFDQVNLKLGASAVTMESLNTDNLELELGAGTFTGTGKIVAEKSQWQVGMGELTLNYLDCEDLDMDCGMGSMSVTMAHRQEDYDCDVTCRAGAVTVGDSNFSMGSHHLKGDDADREVKIQCGMGSVALAFDD